MNRRLRHRNLEKTETEKEDFMATKKGGKRWSTKKAAAGGKKGPSVGGKKGPSVGGKKGPTAGGGK